MKSQDITEALLGCLHNNGFDPHYLQEHLLAFACDGASVMLGRKAGVAVQLCSKIPVCLALFQSQTGTGSLYGMV